MVTFPDDHRAAYGVEPICQVLPIAPSTDYAHKQRQTDPARRSARARRDETLCTTIQRVWQEQRCVYGGRKMWKQLKREDVVVARCAVVRLMRALGLQGGTEGPGVDDDAGGCRAVPAGSCQAAVHRDAAERTLGRGHRRRGDVDRLRLRGVRDRRVRAAHRRLAGVGIDGGAGW